MAIVANPNDYAGSGAKTPTDKIVQASIGGIATTAAVSNSADTAAQNQLNAGASTPSIEAYIASQTDGGINADAGNYMNNRTPDRAAAADVAKSRTPRVSGVYTAEVPQNKIAAAKDNSKSNMLFLLSDTMVDGSMPYMKIGFSDYKRPNPFAAAEMQLKQTIYMPLPQELLDPTQIEWSLTTLNTVGNLASLPGSTANGAPSDIAATAAAAGLGMLGKGIEAFTDTTGRLSRVGGNIGGQIASSVVGGAAGNIVTLIEQSLGAVPNPNPSYAFRGPSLRTYSFSWVIHPRNEVESANMMKVINTLKKFALPGTKIGSSTALLDYPSMCQINLMPWDNGSGPYGWGENTFIKYKKSVITGISANFAPNGVPAFFRGSRKAPVFASLTISFAEIEFFTDLDYEGQPGGDATDFLVRGITQAANTYSSLVGTIGDATSQIVSGAAGLITDPPVEEPPAPPAEPPA